MAVVSQNTKYVKLDDGVSFSLVRTNPKLTTNTKLMYNGKKMYMESYASSELLNRMTYKNVSIKPNSTFNRDISNFLKGAVSQAYSVYQNFSDVTISNSYDNQFETMYWCGAEYIDSNFYEEEIGFVAPLYLREKMPNYFVIFRLDTPSNFNLNIDEQGNKIDTTFDFKTDILDKAVLIKTFDLSEGSVLGKYIRNYVEQESFEFDKSMYVNFSKGEVTYYGINIGNGILERKVENFENELQKNDNPVLYDDKWFTDGFERNKLIFPYIMNIEYLFDDDKFKNGEGEIYDFARYIGVYCNSIEFGEFSDLNELEKSDVTQDSAIYYFEDINNKLHRYSNNEEGLKIDGKESELFDVNLITGFEKERVTGYAEPLDIYEGFVNRAQYGFEILKPLEPGDWVGIEYNGKVECYFADNKNISAGEKTDMLIGEYSDFRFSVNENSTINDIAAALTNCVNRNKKSLFEARCSDNVVAFYAKIEGLGYNGSENGGAKMLMDASLLYNEKISFPISNNVSFVSENDLPIEDISDSDEVINAADFDDRNNIIKYETSSFGSYYVDYFCGACNPDIDDKTDTYKNVFKIYAEEYVVFDTDRYLKTNNGDGRRICANMIYINLEGKVDPEYRLVIVEDAPSNSDSDLNDKGYDVSVSSTYQVEIMDRFKPNHGVFSWFPVKDFDFDINYSKYGQYGAFVDECDILSKKVKYTKLHHTEDTFADSDSRSTQEDTIIGIKDIAKSPFYDDYGDALNTEYEYYFEQFHPDLCTLSKTAPYISKWGYYDEQKDSCENPYRLNISKVFGVSNLSANTYLRNCDEKEYTHSMPYYMTINKPNYIKDYQYIATDEIYATHYDKNSQENRDKFIMLSDSSDNNDNDFSTFFDCVDYWTNVFKNTNEDKFSYFFSGKKYGKRFDKKYSRILGGDKYHNPSTLFRGVKFEVIRQYNGYDKNSSEYNDYRFSFVYIPVMLDSMIFNSTVYFVKNDTFKFIVGIIFVNTMLGTYGHNIFNGEIDYFNKGFLYAACKDIIRPENNKKYTYDLKLEGDNIPEYIDKEHKNVYSDFWKDIYDIGKEINEFYMWVEVGNNDTYGNTLFLTKSGEFTEKNDIIGELSNINMDNAFEYVDKVNTKFDIVDEYIESGFKILWEYYYEDYDVTIYRYKTLKYFGKITCTMNVPNIEFNNLVLTDVCDINWDYFDGQDFGGYSVNVSDLHFKSESLQNILINMGSDSVERIKFYNVDGVKGESSIGEKEFIHETDDNTDSDGGNCKINVDINSGDITIEPIEGNTINTLLECVGNHGEVIENLRMDISIKDKFDTYMESLGLKDYFTVFNQLSMHNITEIINNDYNVKYYSTVEDNKFKIRVIEPDCIEIEDRFESVPVVVTQNNKSVVGSIEIKEKQNVDNIGIKTINRYSGFYNPIFNDILYYDDYTYTKTYSRLNGEVKFELPYSNTNIDYDYKDGYGEFGVIKNMYYHKTNTSRSNKILTSNKPLYPMINEFALDYRDYNIFSSSWDEGYFISQDDLDNSSVCEGIGSMKDSLCMFGSKYLNLPDHIFIDTFENGKSLNDKMVINRDNTDTEIMYKEVSRSVVYKLFIEKRLKRYLKESLMEVFSKYINKNYSFGNKGTIEDDVDEYVEKNLLKLYKVDKIYMYIKDERMRINDRKIENEYLKYVDKNNEFKIQQGFPVVRVKDGVAMKDGKFIMGKINEFDRTVTYNLRAGFKESFGFAVSFKRK